ncbi:MAG: EamA family transporter [Alistipes sp.]|nr:EamA family transporter [Alistipes sp.]
MMISDKVKGYICGMVSGATYGMIPLFSVPVLNEGIGFDSLLFYRYLLAAAVMALLQLVRRRSLAISLKDVPLVLLLGVLFAFSSVFMFMAFDYMPTGLVSTMYFIYPVITAVIMSLLFKERMTWGRVLSLILALVGIGMLYVSDGEERMSLFGVGLTFSAALVYALYIIITNKSRIRKMPSSTLAFWSLAIGAVIFFLRADCGMSLQAVPSVKAWGLILMLAIVPTVVSCTALVMSIRYVGSTVTSILGASEPVTAVLCGTLVFSEPMSWRIFFGIVVIIVAVVVLVAGDDLMAKFRIKSKKRAIN